MSNILAVAYLYRLHNGEVLDSDDSIGKLLSQLLSPDAHLVVTDVESAYYLYLKSMVDPNDASSIQLVKLYEPMIL